MANDEKIARGGTSSARRGGRLIALSKSSRTSVLDADAFGDDMAIDFPSMPDSIELNRAAEYVVHNNIQLPDGIHMYKATKPLEIPFSFKLHAFDEDYCPEGALTLLKIAARLHAFVLPISSGRLNVSVLSKTDADKLRPTPTDGQPVAGKKDDGQIDADSQGTFSTQASTDDGKSGSFYPPVVAWLHLMWISKNRPGISCLGYVREVSVKLFGPWLRGPDDSDSFNLPSSAEYSFIFMHRPGYSNSVGFSNTVVATRPGVSIDAAAKEVKDRLYTTYDLIGMSSFVGFGEATAPAPAPAPVPVSRPFSQNFTPTRLPSNPPAGEPLPPPRKYTSGGKTAFE